MKRLFAVLALAATPAHATPFTDPAAIDGAVAAFTDTPAGSPGGAAQGVDKRLKLAACGSSLALGWYGARRDTVVVQCPDAGGWRLFVPLLQSSSQAASAVLRGEGVTISVTGTGFSVTQPGQALESGPVGAWIRVKSTSSAAEPMRAQVVRPGLVRVDLGNDLP